ncbi:MAG: cytochrome c [Bacteroidota bacterium]|nr:cytochrome c [Bacteroidota bacterium]
MKKNIIVISLVLLCSSLNFVSCSARRVKKDMSAAQSEDPRIMEGRLIFKNQCQKCHPNGESGVGPPLNNINLPNFVIRAKVRSRALLLWAGRMPSFDKHEISNKEMKSLLAYLKDMKKKDSKASK